MSGFKDIVKNGWHPEKSGGIRNSVSGLVGRNKDDASSRASSHVSRPISDLKDPASFAPPPKRTDTGSATAPAPTAGKRKVISSPSKYIDPRTGPDPDPEPALEIAAQDAAGSPPPKPYRANTAQGLPKPPARRDGADGRSPPSYGESSRTRTITSKAAPPSLPPRLPPRTGASPPESPGNSLINDKAVSRLGAAGVSVPALGIGRPGAPRADSLGPHSPRQPSVAHESGDRASQVHVDQLQGRFAKMATSPTGSTAQQTTPPAEGTTWAQKQAALKTASNFHKNPSSVSLSDVRTAASTANNFRQRHGDQIASGARTANNMNQKYGLADKVGALTGSQDAAPSPSSPPALPGPGQVYSGTTVETAGPAVSQAASRKKPAPPPPRKKPGLSAAVPDQSLAATEHAPPPIPTSTRPPF